MKSYRPGVQHYESYCAASRCFQQGGSPRAFLERCLAEVDAHEADVRAFVVLDADAARKLADEATIRWRNGRNLSALDGMPIGVKDCFDVAGWPTRVNSPWFDNAPNAMQDAAHVDSLRRGGAIVLGKTVTTEWTMAMPGPTCNPWDLRRTPGGSSSGSAAAVAARMLPLATGSQVRGSGIRPASICGVPAYKPTLGALNGQGGVDPSPSLNHLVLLGADFADIWAAAQRIASDVGGNAGAAPLALDEFPIAKRPRRLLRQYTVGWDRTDEASKAAFEAWLIELQAQGTEIIEPSSAPHLAEYERATCEVLEWFFHLFWEVRWPLISMRNARPDAFSAIMHGHIHRAEDLSIGQYVAACARREALRELHRKLASEVDGFVTLAHIGPGQLGHPEIGTPWYNDASSAIGAPTVNLPLLSVEGVPLGIQLMGFEDRDAELISFARGLMSLAVDIQPTNGSADTPASVSANTQT